MALNKNINPKLLRALKERTHSLGAHPIFPESVKPINFEEDMFINRYDNIHNKCKNAFQKNMITEKDLIDMSMKLLPETVSIERKHRDKLEKLALDLIVKEFDNHDEVENAAKEIQKRRFINAMIQGSAKKCNHMFHMADNEINAIDPSLMDKYNKIMSGADYSYFLFDDSKPSFPGGLVEVNVPKNPDEKIRVHAKGMTFPVLIHELVKGMMEVISLHGLPSKPELCKFVMDKADFVGAEFWDMRLGVGLWEKFTDLIEPVDFHLKHHIFCDLVEMPVEDFNTNMREIIGGTTKGKRIINNIVHKIKEDIKYDDIEHSLYDIDDDGEDDGIDLNNFDFTKYL
jgi:hypothetical protein